MTPRSELEARVRRAILAVTWNEDAVVAAVSAMFYDVHDEWDRKDTTTFAARPGESWIDNRWLVCRIPVEGVAGGRVPDRTVTA